ncbi:MAG: cyclic nucleotide-binding domain-containing protein [Bdellovibrionota bacterium]
MVKTDIKPAISMLREVKLLQPFKDHELSQIAQLGTSAMYESHANIVIEGEMSWGLYLIFEGLVGIFKNNKLTGEPYDVGQLRTGNFFGEMSLVDNSPRSATVKALTNCQVFYISKEQFNKFLQQSTDLKLRFLESCVKTLVARLRELNDGYVENQYQLWKIALRKEAA